MYRGRTGFTLVELLVVIGIIAVLISILLPALAKARRAAMDVQCMANLKQIGSAVMMYVNDNQGWLPWSEFDGDASNGAGYVYAVPSTGTSAVMWRYQIAPYMTKSTMPTINSNTAAAQNTWGASGVTADVLGQNAFRCPLSFRDTTTDKNNPGQQIPVAVAMQGGYGWNAQYMGLCWKRWNAGTSTWVPRKDPDEIPIKLRQITRPHSEGILCGDTADEDDRNSTHNAIQYAELCTPKIVPQPDNGPDSGQPTRQISRRHGDVAGADAVMSPGGPNLLFADGHVEFMRRIDLFKGRGNAVGYTPVAGSAHIGDDWFYKRTDTATGY